MKIVAKKETRLSSVTIEFTGEEVQFLYDIMGCIGGSAGASRRRYADSIYHGLERLGLSEAADDVSGHISVRDSVA